MIGAGPAGSETAYRLSKAGFDVLVLEKDSKGKEKPCGGGIQLKELMEFGGLPPEVIERKIRKVRIVSPQNNILEVGMKNSRLFAATVKRSVYDRYLQRRAEGEGAEFLFRRKASRIAGRKDGVLVYSGRDCFRARLFIDARGYSGQNRQKAPEMCATYHVWLKGKDIDKKFSDSIELYFLKEVPKGYVWIFPKRNVVSVGIGSTDSISLRKILESFIRKHPVASKKLKGLSTVRRGGGIIPLGIIPKLYSGSSVIVGDAGGFANIIHGGGIYQARKSAAIAAKHCIRFLRTGNQAHLRNYDKEARDFFNNYETEWDKKIRNILWNEKTLEALVEKGKKDRKIQEALGIVLTSARPHKEAYTIMEKKMLEMIYSELDSRTGLYKGIINSKLSRIFDEGIELHSHANEVLLNEKAKRLRACIGILASEMFSGNRRDALNFSLVYEIFHTASLIHDDVIDNSGKRRGRKTLHTRYGVNNAIITGDLLLSKGYSLISKFSDDMPKEQLRALLLIVGDAGEKCCMGQSLDMEMAEKKKYGSIKDYIKMIELKTGSLIEGSVKGGAVVAGASVKHVNAIGRFGKSMGIAFQIIDDSLDLLGGSAANKSVMNDLKQGKATPMLVYALQKAGREERRRIMKSAGNRNLTASMAEDIAEIYRKHGAIEYAQRLSHEYVEKARRELMNLPAGKARERFSEILDVMDYWSMMGE